MTLADGTRPTRTEMADVTDTAELTAATGGTEATGVTGAADVTGAPGEALTRDATAAEEPA